MMNSFIIIQQPTEEELKSKRRKWYLNRTILKLPNLDTYCCQFGTLKIPGVLYFIHKSYIKFKLHDKTRIIGSVLNPFVLAAFIAAEYNNFCTSLILSVRLKLIVSIDEFRAWARYSKFYTSYGPINAFWINMTRETIMIDAPLRSEKLFLDLKGLEDEVMRDFEISKCTGVWARPYFKEP